MTELFPAPAACYDTLQLPGSILWSSRTVVMSLEKSGGQWFGHLEEALRYLVWDIKVS